MEIVVRTPHGDADVTIASHAATTTLGDVVAAVTGQAVPRVVLVDERTVDATMPLDEAGVLRGSVVTTEPPTPATVSGVDVEIVQLAGHGAGRVTRLGAGRYRVGPGRRSSADELSIAPVEDAAFELVVTPTESATEVTVIPDGPVVALDGGVVTGPTPWTDETLTVGARAFQIDNPARNDPARALALADRDGTVPFSRPPRRRSTPSRRPVVDALRDATLAAPTLWERRPSDPDAFVLPIGRRDEDGTIVTVTTIDIGEDQAVAIAGSERFREALARTLVVEACTLHGPADLDVVVLTEPSRLAAWDWAKWLPHVTLDGPPALWGTRHDIVEWADSTARGAQLATAPWISSHLTVVVLDDPTLWNRQEAPLRALVSNPPENLRLLALCDDVTQAPAACTTVISETDGGSARIDRFTRTGDDDDTFRPALTEETVAVRVARALAPLADVDLSAPPPVDDSSDESVELADVLDVNASDEVAARWATAAARPAAPVGRRLAELVEVPMVDVTVVVGPTMGDAFDVAATLLIGQCVDRSPDEVWIAPMTLDRSARSELLWQLPHATLPPPSSDEADPRRLGARLRHVLSEPGGPDRIVLVTEAPASSTAAAGTTWSAALVDLARTIDGLAIVVVTDRPDLDERPGDIEIRVGYRNDNSSNRRRVATIATRDGTRSQPFAPIQRAPELSEAPEQLDVRPSVIGRPLTPLERRIQQHRARVADAPDRSFAASVALLAEAATRHRGHLDGPARIVVPPPLPTRVDLDELFESSPGDGVPLGLADDPAHGGAPTRWWELGSGSLFAYGSRRSGVEQVVATIVLGIIDRFSELDARLIVVEASAARRRTLGDVDRDLRVVAPDHHGDIAAVLDDIDAELARPQPSDDPRAAERPHLVVAISDLVDLRRRYATHPLGDRIDATVTAAATSSHIDVIAYASDLDGAGPFATVASNRLVGASSDHRELTELGVDQPSDVDGVVGRCRSFPDGDLVQLATPDAPPDPSDMMVERGSHGSSR